MHYYKYTLTTTTHIVEVVDKAVVNRGDKIAHLTPVWQLTLIVLFSHVVD